MKNIIIVLLLIEFCFSKTVSISGSIINDEGKPSRKAEVTLFGIDDSPIGLVKTNRKGRFEFSDINPDYYYLVYLWKLYGKWIAHSFYMYSL